MRHRRAGVFVLAAVAIAAAVTGFAKQPVSRHDYGWLAEAEDWRASAENFTVDDKYASGKSAVSSKTAWQPLALFKGLQADLPERFEIWVRRRGGAVCLKTFEPDGKQRELGWSWGSVKDWTWKKAGVFGRDLFDGGLLVIRGGEEGVTSLDAVAVVTNAALAAVAFAPEERQASVRIDWSKPDGKRLSPAHWAINDYEITKAEKPSPKFDGLLDGLNPSLIRIHHAGMADAWTDAKIRSWDKKKIAKAFRIMPVYKNKKIMVNICSWPRWLHDGEILPVEKHEEFADFCAGLARIFREDLQIPVAYWELPNERDSAYERAGRLPELWALYSKLAKAVRKADPQAKVGGPAFTWPKPIWVDGFLKDSAGDFDFVSWHNYASGSRDEGTDVILTDKIDAISANARFVKDRLDALGLGGRVETFLTEYNISWTWETRDERMRNNIGAVFDALVVKNMAQTGIDGAFVWHLKDNIYGLLDAENKTRPAYHLLKLGRAWMVGKTFAAEISDEARLQAIALENGKGKKRVLLINRSANPLTVPGAKTAIGCAEIVEGRIDGDGVSGPHLLKDVSGPLRMKPYSLLFLLQK